VFKVLRLKRERALSDPIRATKAPLAQLIVGVDGADKTTRIDPTHSLFFLHLIFTDEAQADVQLFNRIKEKEPRKSFSLTRIRHLSILLAGPLFLFRT